MEKYSFTYPERRTFGKYDTENIIGYLNEEVIPDYVPETYAGGEGGESPKPVTGYRYTGTEKDGGTVMPCHDSSSYPEVANAIIRSRFSESEEMAIHRHHGNDPKEYADEWDEYNEFCESAKALAKQWLGL